MNIANGAGRADAFPGDTVSQKTFEAIRKAAVDGLLALPRGGIGIGGFLLGIRRNGRVEILDSLEISCAHARGPAFLLTPEEVEHARSLQFAVAPLEILGLYFSRTRGPSELDASYIELFNALCPAPGGMALLVRPSAIDLVEAAIFVRTSRREIELMQEWNMKDWPDAGALQDRGSADPTEPHVEPVAPEHVLANGNSISTARSTADTFPIEFEVAMPAGPSPEIQDQRPSASWPQSAEPSRPPERRDGRGRKLLYAGVLVLLAAAALITRGPRGRAPQLKLHAADENGAIVFRWNPDAVAGAQRGRLLVNDSGQFSEFRLDARGLASGSFRYGRKSGRVIGKLAVGEREAHAVFFVASPNRPGSSGDSTSPAAPPRKRTQRQ